MTRFANDDDINAAPRLTHLGHLYLLHIPKTAGTSLRQWLEGLYNVEDCCPLYHPCELPDDPKQYLTKYKFFAGHHQWRFVERWGSKLGLTTITFLRDPIQRTRSEFQYLRGFNQDECHKYRDRTWVSGWVLDQLAYASDSEIAQDVQYIREVGNRQTRDLGITQSPPRPDGNRCEDPPIPISQAQLRVAFQNLRSCAAFGIVEDMERSMLLIADALGLPALGTPLHLNRSKKEGDIQKDGYEDAFSASNSLDLQLYHEGKDLFELQWEALVDRYQKTGEQSDFGSLCKAMTERFRHTDRKVPLLTRFVADASHGIISRGWTHRFFYYPIQRWLKWSESKRPVFWLPIDRTNDCSLFIRIAFTSDETVPKTLGVEVDGCRTAFILKYTMWPGSTVYHIVLEVTLPRLEPSPQYTEIACTLPSGGAIALCELELESSERPAYSVT